MYKYENNTNKTHIFYISELCEPFTYVTRNVSK